MSKAIITAQTVGQFGRESAIGFLEWVEDSKFIEEDGFYYEQPKRNFALGKGICVAVSRDDLYDKYIAAKAGKPGK